MHSQPIDRFRVQSGNVSLAVSRRGDPGRPTVLLVHGYPDNQSVWNEVAAQLADQFQVVTYDVRGAGESDAPTATADYNMRHLLADTLAVIDAVSPDQPVHLVGHDWGAIQTWEAATEEGLEHRIASFTSISGVCLDHAGMILQNELKRRNLPGLRKVANQLLHSWYIGMFHLPVLAPASWRLGLARLWPEVLSLLEGVRPEDNPHQRRDGVLGINLYRANMLPHLSRPRQRIAQLPVQMIVATRDPFVTPGMLGDCTGWIPELWWREIDAGHWLPLTNPQRLVNWITDFVQLHEGGPESASLKRARKHQTAAPERASLAS